MSTTAYAAGDPEARKAWAKIVAVETLDKTYIGQFIGPSDEHLVQSRDELAKDAGDRVRVFLRMQLTGRGVQGDAPLKGNEEALTTHYDDVILDQRRHAASAGGRMSRQRVPWDVRRQCMDALSDWAADLMDASFFNQICGYTVDGADTAYTGNNPVQAPSRVIRPGANGSDQQLAGDTTGVFDLKLIDRAKVKATATPQGTPAIRPLNIKGRKYFVMFLHPYQVFQLRGGTAAGQWQDIQKAAMAGGDVSDNPIFTGALGVYNGVVLHEAQRIPCGVHSTNNTMVSNVRRAVLCGAQAAAVAFGQGHSFENFDWNEELDDYENQLGVGGGCIFGLKKLRFNDIDHASVVVPTYAPDPA